MNWRPPDIRFAVTTDEIVARSVDLECDAEDFDAISVLQDEVEDAIDDLAEAKAGNREGKKLKQLESRLTSLEQKLEAATNVKIALHHELDTLKRSGNSQLEIVSTDRDINNPRLTKYSVYTWLREKLDLTIEEWAPPGSMGGPDSAALDTGHEPSKKRSKFREDSENGYQRIVEGLVVLLLKESTNRKYVLNGKVNQSKLSDDLIAALKPHPRNLEIPAKETIQRKLRESDVGKLKAPDAKS